MLGQLIDSETHSLSSLVSSFLQPPISRMTGGLFRAKMSCLFCRPNPSFLCCLGSSAHPPAQGGGPLPSLPSGLTQDILVGVWPVGRQCSVRFLKPRMLGGELPAKKLLFFQLPEALTDGYRSDDPQVTSKLERLQLWI